MSLWCQVTDKSNKVVLELPMDKLGVAATKGNATHMCCIPYTFNM